MITANKIKVAKAVVNSRSIKEAMIKAGYAESTAKTQVARLTKDEEWLALLDKELSDDKLARVHSEGLEANKTISALSGKEANGGTVDFVDVPDYATRVKYLDLAYKVKKKISNGLEVNNNTFNLQLSPELQEKTARAIKLLEEQDASPSDAV